MLSSTPSAGPCNERSSRSEAGVASMLISTVYAPRSLAAKTREAAGWTCDDVPIVKNTSQSSASTDLCSTEGWIPSPNHTTPGRTIPLQCGQFGGISGNGTVSSSHRGGDGGQLFQHCTSQIDPWNRITFRVPARSCSPSTFCVISVKFG